MTDLTIHPQNASCLRLNWSHSVNADVNTPFSHVIVDYRRSGDVDIEPKSSGNSNAGDVEDDDGGSSDVDSDPRWKNVTGVGGKVVVCGLGFWTKYDVNVTAVSAAGEHGKTVTVSQRTGEYGW